MCHRFRNSNHDVMFFQVADKAMNGATLAGIAGHQDSTELRMLMNNAEDILELEDLDVVISGALAFS